MILKIWTPERPVLETKADKIIAEAVNGYFCLLPRHIDFLAGLVSGVLQYSDKGIDHFWAVSRGILIKRGPDVMVSVRNAVEGTGLDELEIVVRDQFMELDQKEGEIGIAMRQLEADFLRRFVELSERRAGG